MKKIKSLLFIAGMLFFGLSFKTDSTAGKPVNDWGEWRSLSCFKGIDFRTRRGDYNSYARKYYWYVQFRNRYQETINFDYSISEAGERNDPDHRTPVAGGSLSESKVALLNGAEGCHVEVGRVRFGYNDSGSYYSCDQ